MASPETRLALAAVPRVSQEIVDEILDHLVVSSQPDVRSLRSCSLVSKSWVLPSRRHLFRTIRFLPWSMTRWLETFLVPEESPARHVRVLCLWLGRSGAHHIVPEGFAKHIPCFTNVKELSLQGISRHLSLRSPFFTRLPQSVTSLNIEGIFDPAEVRDVVVQFPDLDDLYLCGVASTVGGEDRSQRIGRVPIGRFRGIFGLSTDRVDLEVVNMLLEVPTGLHFTELHIQPENVSSLGIPESECLLPAVRLAEACSGTLVKLIYISVHAGRETFIRSFDFTKFPSLREVTFLTHWIKDLGWILRALSTLKLATSPILSVVRLGFDESTPPHEITEEQMGDDLQRIANELTRIEREYEGAVDLVVVRSSDFRPLDVNNVLQRWEP